ncbi:uncharacterized protein PSANT_05219 [Moesziomyces antarcticus]|uniref:Uncharacterized protein n=1 Tax=Pseudozyma antarctica TaxID=84753 RepID=A0A5C3FVB2_PSEA2|nr:uncharacterized protein PSANT_05219 [Moesziomyces antarcticus]
MDGRCDLVISILTAMNREERKEGVAAGADVFEVAQPATCISLAAPSNFFTAEQSLRVRGSTNTAQVPHRGLGTPVQNYENRIQSHVLGHSLLFARVGIPEFVN